MKHCQISAHVYCADSLSYHLQFPEEKKMIHQLKPFMSGSSCSKLTTLLVNVSLKFIRLITEICQYFLLKKCEKLLQCKSFYHFFNNKYQCLWLLSRETLNELTS